MYIVVDKFKEITVMFYGVSYGTQGYGNSIYANGCDWYYDVKDGGSYSDFGYYDCNVTVTCDYVLDWGYKNIKATGNDEVCLTGNGDDNVIVGNDCDNELDGGQGHDVIDGKGGDDTINGEGGDDDIYGGEGCDTINGGDGCDIISGEGSDDTLSGGGSDDKIDGGDGDDKINGNEGNDDLSGGAGCDTIDGGAGCDNISGGEGDDKIIGGNDADCLSGDAGCDWLDGGYGNDVIKGGAGGDTYVYGECDGADTIIDCDAGGETDTVEFKECFSLTDVCFNVSGSDLLVTTGREGDTITIDNWFSGGENQIEQFTFAADGVSVTNEQINSKLTGECYTICANDLVAVVQEQATAAVPAV